MAGVAYEDVGKVLLERFPEFTESHHYDPDDVDVPYMLWSGFGNFVTTYIRRSPAERLDGDSFVARVFDLANELMDSEDPVTNDVVITELLENFSAYRKTFELARRKLKTEHLTWLERQRDLSDSADLHYEGELISHRGLDVLARLVKECSWCIEVRWVESTGMRYLESHDPRVGLEMVQVKGPGMLSLGPSMRRRNPAPV